MRATWILGASLAMACLVLTGPARASNEIAKQEDLVCTVCHDKPGSKLLTDQGKYYEAVATLDGYDEVKAVFGSCTHCHVKKPGSLRLTREGRRFARVIDGMEELRQWMMAIHPALDQDGPSAGGAAGGEQGGSPADQDPGPPDLMPVHRPLR